MNFSGHKSPATPNARDNCTSRHKPKEFMERIPTRITILLEREGGIQQKLRRYLARTALLGICLATLERGCLQRARKKDQHAEFSESALAHFMKFINQTAALAALFLPSRKTESHPALGMIPEGLASTVTSTLAPSFSFTGRPFSSVRVFSMRISW